ncbi:DedA family protein [Litorivivens sp.]|uniref:DedA family protein n=1 Tax=Litorivivens sp. TaxID=2020868 RepID=UPI003566D0DC
MIGEIFLEWVENYGEYAVFIVPVIAFLEASVGIGLFVSGAILLSVCTLLYSQNIVPLYQMLPLAFLGAALADHMGFFLGRWLGPSFHQTRFARRHANRLAQTERMLTRHGEVSIILGRLIPAVRSVVPLMTGISGLPVSRYVRYDLLACSIWITGLGALVVGISGVLS